LASLLGDLIKGGGPGCLVIEMHGVSPNCQIKLLSLQSIGLSTSTNTKAQSLSIRLAIQLIEQDKWKLSTINQLNCSDTQFVTANEWA